MKESTKITTTSQGLANELKKSSLVYNVLYITEAVKLPHEPEKGSAILCNIAHFTPETLNPSYNRSISPSALFNFLTAPNLPIKSNINDFYSALCRIEELTSEGKNRSPIINFENQPCNFHYFPFCSSIDNRTDFIYNIVSKSNPYPYRKDTPDEKRQPKSADSHSRSFGNTQKSISRRPLRP